MKIIPLIILGAGGNSLSIVDAVEEINRRSATAIYEIRGFLDDIPENQSKTVLGFPVLGKIDRAGDFSDCRFINGIASVASYTKKPEINARSKIPDDKFVSIIHPTATVSPNSRVGIGTAIMANSVICAEAEVGDHVIILQNTVVNHHSTVGDYATLSSGITVLGYVTIARSAFIGGGSALRPYVTIGEAALVGMGSVVIKDVKPHTTVAGNPARPFQPKP